MKTTNHFKNAIKTHLDKRAEDDILFSFQYTKTTKNLDDCCLYILNTVHQSGCNGLHDDEVFSMAVHYYTEDNIDIGKPINNCNIIVNHTVVLTEQEKQEARKEAIQKAQNEAYNKMMQPKKKAKRVEMNNQPSLFDF